MCGAKGKNDGKKEIILSLIKKKTGTIKLGLVM